MVNCTTFLDTHVRLGDKLALVHPKAGTAYSYNDLCTVVNKTASVLAGYGIGPGDAVGIYLPSTVDHIMWYLAIWRVGAVAVPLNIVLREAELLHMLGDAEICCVVTNTESRGYIDAVADRASHFERVITIRTAEWEEERAKASATFRAHYGGYDDICQLQYTSGTTGNQKGAMLTHGNWMAAMDAERELLCLTENDTYLGIYPMSHVGVSWGFSALKAGATWVVMERFDLEEYIRLTRQYRITVLASMPPVIHSLTRTPPGTEDAFVTVREMISGGGPLLPSVWKTFHDRFKIPIVNAYGLSETIVVGTGTAVRPEDYVTADQYQSVGRPIGYAEVKIVDVADPEQECAIGEDGEIALRGPGVAIGYWKMDKETHEVFLPEGWFLTGDIGYLDTEGMLFITDRKKDMIVMSGWKIYPTEIEKVLIEHPAIQDLAIFGCPDEHRGEIPVAAVVLRKGETLTPEELVVWAKERVASYKIPREMIVVDTLPRVNGWKLLRRELRESFCSENSSE